MSTTGPSLPSQPSPQTELCLTSVEITFLAKLPKKKIRLVVKLDGQDHEVSIDNGRSLRWTGEIHGLSGAKIVIDAHWRSFLPFRKKSTTAQTILTDCPSPIFDDKKKIRVILTTTPSQRAAVRPMQSGSPSSSQAPHAVGELKNDTPAFADVATEVAAAEAKVAEKLPIVEKLSPILRVLKIIATIGEPLKDIHPAVKYAIGGIDALIKICEMQTTCRAEALDLVEQLTSFLSVEKHADVLAKRAETRRAVCVMLELMNDISIYICKKTSTGVCGIIGDLIGSEYREKIAKLKTDFGRAKDSFDRSVQLEIFVAVSSIDMATQAMFLHEKLLQCENAHFRSDNGCLSGTRTDLCQRAMKWIDNADGAQPGLFWLHGNAGSGKSTVANTIASMIKDGRRHHLSCFFCKRDDQDLSNPRRLFPTLAYRFASQHESYRAAILKVLNDGNECAGIATTATVKLQFVKLFQELLTDTVDPLRPHVVVVDALDECGSSKDQIELATYLLALSRAVPWVKIFVTSRSEPAIYKVFAQTEDCLPYNINNETGVNDDIQLYIKTQAAEIRPPLNPPLSDENVQQLAGQAAGLFIWCSTLFKYLHEGLGARSLLTEILKRKGPYGPSQPWSQLYELYDSILKSAVAREPDVSFMRTVLLIVNVVKDNRPLSTQAIMSFLHHQEPQTRFSSEDAVSVIERLHSVLYVDKSASDAVRAHHISFYNFLQQKADTSGESGWQTLSEIHALMAQSSIAVLNTELKFNMCKIDTPILNQDVCDLAARISEHISVELQYSTRFWCTHLPPSALPVDDVASAVLELLCTKKVLFLLECLSLQGSLRQDEIIFRRSMASFFQDNTPVLEVVQDIHSFVVSFSDAMDSIPHIYLSALLWLPEESRIYKNLGLSTKRNWNLIDNKSKQWDATVWHFHGDEVGSTAFSPDGSNIAYGGKDGNVYIRNLQTGILDGEPFRGHGDRVSSLAYSPDGSCLLSGSWDQTIRIWNVKSGRAILECRVNDRVNCAAYSPDGFFVAATTDDHTIQTRNKETGEPDGKPLLHTTTVWAIAYSPDGHFIASGCSDGCIYIWDTTSHHEVASLQGHRSSVLSVAYSPDGRLIASGSLDQTIRIWNAQTNEMIGHPLEGHTNPVISVAYSPDSRLVLSGSLDGTVRLWNAISSTPIGNPVQSHSGAVQCASYSPDGSLVAFGSSNGLQVQNTSTFLMADDKPQVPIRVHAPTYSPDGRLIASDSNSDLICIWDAQTGAPVETPPLRHTGMRQGGSISSVTYSNDGNLIVSGSDDEDNSTVCILDAHTGATICGPFDKRSSGINSVAYSPNDRFVASASLDGTVRLWNVETRTSTNVPLRGHAVAFSPDGRFLACANEDRRLCFCEILDNGTSFEDRPLAFECGLDGAPLMAFSADGRYIATSGPHGPSIWDVQTGESSGTLLPGPSDMPGHQVAYSPNSRFLAWRSWSGVTILDAQSGLRCGELLKCPSMAIHRRDRMEYSPDGRFIASGVADGLIYVHSVPSERDRVEARWIACCSQMDTRDGWLKYDETLLLWIPPSYRVDVQRGFRFTIPNSTPNIISKIINAGPTQAEWIRAGRLLPNSGPSTGPGQPTVNSMELGRGTSSR